MRTLEHKDINKGFDRLKMGRCKYCDKVLWVGWTCCVDCYYKKDLV